MSRINTIRVSDERHRQLNQLKSMYGVRSIDAVIAKLIGLNFNVVDTDWGKMLEEKRSK